MPPELAPLAIKHRGDLDVISTKRAASIVQAGRSYTMALNTAERTATSAGDLKALSTISAEREGIKLGRLSLLLPKDLPKDIPTPRKNYLAEIAKVNAAIEAQKQRALADYLRALNALQRSTSNAVLREQIEAEKKRS